MAGKTYISGNVTFSNVNEPLLNAGSRLKNNKYALTSDGKIAYTYPVINAIDIDWSNAYLSNKKAYINTTADLLGLIDDLKNEGITDETIQYIDEQIQNLIIPTKVSDLDDASDYLKTTSPLLDKFVTEDWVNVQIQEFKGDSAYIVAKKWYENNGFTFPYANEGAWLESLKGVDGSPGTDGKNAYIQAYEYAQSNGISFPYANQSEWLSSLVDSMTKASQLDPLSINDKIGNIENAESDLYAYSHENIGYLNSYISEFKSDVSNYKDQTDEKIGQLSYDFSQLDTEKLISVQINSDILSQIKEVPGRISYIYVNNEELDVVEKRVDIDIPITDIELNNKKFDINTENHLAYLTVTSDDIKIGSITISDDINANMSISDALKIIANYNGTDIKVGKDISDDISISTDIATALDIISKYNASDIKVGEKIGDIKESSSIADALKTISSFKGSDITIGKDIEDTTISKDTDLAEALRIIAQDVKNLKINAKDGGLQTVTVNGVQDESGIIKITGKDTEVGEAIPNTNIESSTSISEALKIISEYALSGSSDITVNNISKDENNNINIKSTDIYIGEDITSSIRQTTLISDAIKSLAKDIEDEKIKWAQVN